MAEHAHRLAAKASESFTTSPHGERGRRAPTLENVPNPCDLVLTHSGRRRDEDIPDCAFDSDSGFV
jgi:hypothetical protein